jgi:hypothetical protein
MRAASRWIGQDSPQGKLVPVTVCHDAQLHAGSLGRFAATVFSALDPLPAG